MDAAIRNLTEDEEFLYSSRILIALMYNILDDPFNEKYRRLRTGAKVSDAKLLSCTYAIIVLRFVLRVI